MQPFINPGDRIFVEMTKTNNLNLGDIIVFMSKRKCLSHRIVMKKKGKLVTKGDNVKAADKPIRHNEILGKVTRIEGIHGLIDLEKKINKVFQFIFVIQLIINENVYIPFSYRFRYILIKLLASNRKKVYM